MGYFIGLCSTVVLWAGFALLYHLVDEPALEHVLTDLGMLPIIAMPVVWLLFSTVVAGYRRPAWGRLALLLAVPVMSVLLLATNSSHGLSFSGGAQDLVGGSLVYVHQFGPWFWVHTVYSYGLMIGGLVVVALLGSRIRDERRFTSASILIGAVFPLILNALFVASPTFVGGADPSPIGLSVTMAFYGFAVFRYRVLELPPARYSQVLSALDDSWVLLSDCGEVIEASGRAKTILGDDAVRVGCDVSGILLRLWDAKGEASTEVEVELDVDSERVWYEARIVPMADLGDTDPTHWLVHLRDNDGDVRRERALRSLLEHERRRLKQAKEALARLEADFRPRLKGIAGLGLAISDESGGDPELAYAAELLGTTAQTLDKSLQAAMRKAEITRPDASDERSKTPSRAPVRRSAGDRRASGKRARDPLP